MGRGGARAFTRADVWDDDITALRAAACRVGSSWSGSRRRVTSSSASPSLGLILLTDTGRETQTRIGNDRLAVLPLHVGQLLDQRGD